MKILHVTVVVVTFILSPVQLKAADLSIDSLTLFGYHEGKEEEVVYREGKEYQLLGKGKKLRLKLEKFDNVFGVDADTIDIEVSVKATGQITEENVEVRLALIPKIGYFVYFPDKSGKDTHIWDTSATEKTAVWSGPIILEKKTIQRPLDNIPTKVIFENINLRQIVDKYLKQKLWATNLKFQVYIEPKEKEDSFLNNMVSRDLRLPVPVY